MNRAFISLYLLVVTSVILLGLGMNRFWESLTPDNLPPTEIKALFQILKGEFADPQHQTDQFVAQMAKDLSLDIQLLSQDDIAASSGMNFDQPDAIFSATNKDIVTWYSRLPNQTKIMLITINNRDASRSPLYKILLITFYAGIALMIFLWVWPLSRDAKKLEQQTQLLGKDDLPEPLDISPSSTLYSLARAFNQMAQRLRDLISSHRDMTNAVSHELRTPLARMKFSLAMLEAQPQSEKNQKQHANISQDISEMESLIGSLLLYAGFEQQSQSLQQCEGHMRALIEDLCTRIMRNNSRRIVLDIVDHTDNAIFCCEWKLIETVLHNLIHNAMRYADSKIIIGLALRENNYTIFVEDDGPGIPESDRQRVFDSFVRLHQETTASPSGGFGLGLAIVKRIMKWHKGDAVFTAPELLKGTRAVIHWPQLITQ